MCSLLYSGLFSKVPHVSIDCKMWRQDCKRDEWIKNLKDQKLNREFFQQQTAHTTKIISQTCFYDHTHYIKHSYYIIFNVHDFQLKYIANSSWHWGSYGSIWTGLSPKNYYMDRSFWGPYNIFWVTDRSIYCHMTRSDMNYLLYYTFYLK